MFSCCWAPWSLLKFCMISKKCSGVIHTLCSLLWYLEAGIIRKCFSVAWDMWTPKQPVVPQSLSPLDSRAASAMCLPVTFEKAGPSSLVIFPWHSWRSVCLCVWVVACMHDEVRQSCLTLHDLWTVAHQAPLSMGFSRQECWNGLPFPPPGDLPNPGMELKSLMSPALAGGIITTSAAWETCLCG